MPPLQQRYHDALMHRVREERYPSHQLLNRIEASFWTPEQVVDYIDMLLDKLDESWYPSHQMMERIERVMRLAAIA